MMSSLVQSGVNNGLLLYTDDNDVKLRIVIAHIVSYQRRRDRTLQVNTARDSSTLKLDTKADVTAGIQLLNGLF